uniref:Death domain-containing protein n=1 Tax=Amphimedon queenslandica TaxID=400682 RepID=A0A1X7U557_AMPQE
MTEAGTVLGWNYSEAEECLKACISKWLSRTDDVDANGGANWSTLCDAIERINETGAHFIRDQHGIIPSQPVEQINYQGHSEPSKIESSDDGGQLRQRSSAAPSNESSGTEGADKPPPPSNSSSSGKTSNANGLYLVFLLLLSGDVELNPGPADATDNESKEAEETDGTPPSNPLVPEASSDKPLKWYEKKSVIVLVFCLMLLAFVVDSIFLKGYVKELLLAIIAVIHHFK